MEERVKVLNRDVIKYFAMFTMLLNHIANVFLAPGTALYDIFLNLGYFTAVTMCYFLVEGYQVQRKICAAAAYICGDFTGSIQHGVCRRGLYGI